MQAPGIRLRLVQQRAAAEPADNRAVLAATAPGADVVIYPEAFSRDFGPSGSPMVGEALEGDFTRTLADASVISGATVLAGMFETSRSDRPFNTLVVAAGGRLIAAYRKVHLYDSFGFKESESITPGEIVPTVISIGGLPNHGLQVGLMTCYDLRFPEMARALVAAGAEALVVVAAWVAGPRKVEHWETLLRARAIENLCFVIAVGQPGPKYVGHSQVISPYGDVLGRLEGERGIIEVEIDPAEVAAARAANPSLDNRRF